MADLGFAVKLDKATDFIGRDALLDQGPEPGLAAADQRFVGGRHRPEPITAAAVAAEAG